MIQMTADEKNKGPSGRLARNGADLNNATRLAEISNKNGVNFDRTEEVSCAIYSNNPTKGDKTESTGEVHFYIGMQ